MYCLNESNEANKLLPIANAEQLKAYNDTIPTHCAINSHNTLIVYRIMRYSISLF